MGPGLTFERPPTIAIAFKRIADIAALHMFWLPYEQRALRRHKHPDDRALLRSAILATEEAHGAVAAFLACPGEDEATEAGISVYRASLTWSMLQRRCNARRTARRASVWIDSFAIWSRTLSDASPYADAFDEDQVWWEETIR